MMSIEFVLEHVHPEALKALRSHFVYGYKPGHEDPTSDLEQELRQIKGIEPSNVQLNRTALSRWGSHHSKLMVLVFGDGTLQVVIHTANLIPVDWDNLTQGVWMSPRLKKSAQSGGDGDASADSSIGHQFKRDFIKYLAAYKTKSTDRAVKLVQEFDFSPVKAHLVASVPGNYQPNGADYRQWGLCRLQKVLQSINCKGGQLVAQISSIASLGPSQSTYLNSVEQALNGQPVNSKDKPLCEMDIVYPTVQDVQESLGGYMSGTSIHLRRQQPQEKKQMEYIGPRLRKWAAVEAGRQRAAPHIKTYFRTTPDSRALKWFMLTSANLSKQAWGIVNKTKGNQWIQSWECGVLVTANMFGYDSFTPIYKRDCGPDPGVYIRMAYDIPLSRYSSGDKAWSSHDTYRDPDWLGYSWVEYFPGVHGPHGPQNG